MRYGESTEAVEGRCWCAGGMLNLSCLFICLSGCFGSRESPKVFGPERRPGNTPAGKVG
jgi:hypothetical protein